MGSELTLEILEEAIKQLPPITYPKRIRVSCGDYQRLRKACNLFKICPQQPPSITYGFLGEEICPDIDISDGLYEVDW